jgi:Alkyl sulfatase C-terminal/Alkyl sulfatase dimerisation
VFADSGNQQARDLQAEAFEQLGYQSEGPQWRNIFLAAMELREGVNTGTRIATATLETILAMPVGILLDYIAIRLDGPRAGGTRLAINITFTDQPGPRSVKVQNGVLHHWTRHTLDADLTLTLTKAQLVMALLQPDTRQGNRRRLHHSRRRPQHPADPDRPARHLRPALQPGDTQRRTLRCLGAPETMIFRDLPSSSRGAVLTTRFACPGRCRDRCALHRWLAR